LHTGKEGRRHKLAAQDGRNDQEIKVEFEALCHKPEVGSSLCPLFALYFILSNTAFFNSI
jgi:hypothetical protein